MCLDLIFYNFTYCFFKVKARRAQLRKRIFPQRRKKTELCQRLNLFNLWTYLLAVVVLVMASINQVWPKQNGLLNAMNLLPKLLRPTILILMFSRQIVTCYSKLSWRLRLKARIPYTMERSCLRKAKLIYFVGVLHVKDSQA